MQTNSCGNKLKPSKSYRDSEDTAAKEVVGSDSEFKSKVFYSEEKKRSIDSPGYIRSSSHNNSSPSFPTIVVCQRDSKPLGRSRGRARDDFRMARGGSVSERRGGGGNGIGGTSANVRSRGPGGMSRKAVERDIEPGVGGFVPRGKFQESLNKSSSGDVLSSASSNSSKNVNEIEGNKNRIDCFFMLPEDARISKLLRRLNREDDPEKSISITKQLQEAFQNSENGRYIRRSVDIIADSLLEVLRRGPGSEARLQAARCLGKLGYALESDFKRFSEWLFNKYSSERGEEVRRLLMVALLETLKTDARTGGYGGGHETKGESLVKLKDFSAHLMAQLQTALENTCLPELLIATVDVLLFLAKLCPESFTKHFRDTVDILVGWHIDGGQPHWVSTYASQTLRKFRPFWLADLGFSVNLLAQFIEDVEAFGEDLLQTESGRSSPEDKPPSSPEDHVFRITQLIKVFNTVVRSLGNGLTPSVPPAPQSPVTWPFLVDGLQKVLKAVHAALSTPISSHQNYEDLIVSANECVCLLLSLLHSRMGTSVLEALKTFLMSQISLTPSLSHIARVSMLSAIAKTVREVSSNLPPELVPALISPVSPITSPLLELRLSACCPGPYDCPCRNANPESKGVGGEGEVLLLVHHALLSLKNVPLLQEAYRYVLLELESAYNKLVPSISLLSSPPSSSTEPNEVMDENDQSEKAQIIVIYQLRAISDLANASNSIIGMWALKPSILELLAVRMQPYNQRLAIKWPHIQHAILYLLRSHCQRYNHFVSSSGLVATGSGGSVIGGPTEVGGLVVPSGSPTSGHLSTILQLLAKILNEPETGEPARLLALLWSQEVISQCNPYLYGKNGGMWRGHGTEFSDFLWALVFCGRTHKRQITHAVLVALSTLLEANSSSTRFCGENSCSKVLPPDMVPFIVDMCVQHLDWPEPELKKLQPLLLRILPHLPWPVALPVLLSRLTAAAPLPVPHINVVGAITQTSTSSQKDSIISNASESKAFDSKEVSPKKLRKEDLRRSRMSKLKTWRSVMCDGGSRGTFGGEMHPTHFRPFMAFLLHGIQHSDKNWLSQSFVSCWPLQHGQGSFEGNMRNNIVAALTGKKGVEGRLEDQSMALELALSSEATLLSWAAHQAAQLCVRMKLRTPLGKPQDTFTSIESAIKIIAREGPHVLIHQSKSDTNEQVLPYGGGIRKWLARMQPLTRRAMVLLDFLEQLEKAAYNAWEGCAVSMTPPPKPVRMFFRTNKSTCAEWLGRIRWASMTVAVQRTTHGAPAHALRHGQMMLAALAESANVRSSEFERCILYVAWSLCMLGEPEAIVGLQEWCTSAVNNLGEDGESAISPAKFTWLRAISHQAAGRYEAALKEYLTVVEENDAVECDEGKPDQIDSHVMAFVRKQIEDCYCSLQAWDAALLWCEKDSLKAENQSGWLYERKSASILKILSDFPSSFNISDAQNKVVVSVDNDEDASDEEMVFKEPLWEKYRLKDGIIGAASCTVGKVESVLQSVALMLIKDGSKISDALKVSLLDEVEGCEKALQLHMREGLLSNPANFLPEACVLQYAAAGLHSVLEGKSGTFLFDLSESDDLDPGIGSSLLGRLLWWSHIFSADLEDDLVISRLRLCAARAARWEGNFDLCERLLEKEMRVHCTKEIFVMENLQVTSEHAKFLHYTGKHQGAIDLAARTCLKVCNAFENKRSPENICVRDRCSRLLLSLSKWIQCVPMETADTDTMNSSMHESVAILPSMLELLDWERNASILSLDTTPPGFEELAVNNAWKNGEMSDSSTALPCLIRLAITTCPELAKAWASLGGWCYDMGRKTVEEISMPAIAGGSNIPMWLSEEEIVAAQNIFIPTLLTNQEILQTCEFLALRMSEGDIEGRDLICDISSDLAALSIDVKDQQKLDNVPPADDQEISEMSSPRGHLSILNDQNLNDLCVLVQNALKRRYVHYEMAVAAYFRYLHLSGGDEDDKHKESAVNSADSTTRLMASLRLLRLVSSPLRAHVRLRPYLEHGVASTPVAPWVPLLPQLLSRLGHASTPPYARKGLSGLLCRLPQHLVAFPAVVGATADTLTKGPGLRQPSGPKGNIRCKSGGLQDEPQDETASGIFEGSLSPSGEGDEGEREDEEKDKADENEKATERSDGEVVDEEDEEEEDEEDEEEEEGSVGEMQASVMRNCFQSIVDSLAKKNPECVAGVQTLVKELRRTTLLWDEAWLGLLAQQSTEAARRCSQAEAEAARTYANSRITDPAVRDKIIMEKHRIIIAPVLWALEQLYSLTCVVPPETPHERRFRDRHGPLLTELLSRMRHPPDPRHPNESWLSLYHRIQASLRGGSSSGPPSLRMSEVSPVLAAMRGTAVAMPGANNSTGNVVTIEGVHEHVTILPTKTRPKKLVFHGSDGQKYTYLFKGLEDLHLDERIMQFLSVANTMMARSSRKYSNLDVLSRGGGGWKYRGSLYRARHYSVTPLGPRAGLISWVEGATPLFGLYKRWQHRQAAAAAAVAAAAAAKPPGSQSASGPATNTSRSSAGAAGGPSGILRPSELFHSKLAPLLKERGIPAPLAPGPHGGGGYVPADGRRDWPPQVLRQVLTQLMEETPRDLLAKELWCRSANASAWWQATRTYAHSVAVMSIIGYVIGLGDRHLDNVLVDLETGEVVHIDYNVCFEKGRTLRVPEKVPFRMTPNLEAALGVTGIEGTFRLACEHVLQTLQKGSETLLTLLEAFVYDPLVDWTPGNEAEYAGSVYGGGWSHRRPQGSAALEGRQSRKEMEKELTKSMFIVRVEEMETEWFANQDDLKDLLPQAKVQLEAWEAARAAYRARAHTLQGWHHVLAALKDAEANCMVLTACEAVETKDVDVNESGDVCNLPAKGLMVNGADLDTPGDGENILEHAKKGLMEAIQEWEAQEELHQAALSSLFGPQLSMWIQEMQSFPIEEREGDESRESFDLVRGLLQSLGSGQLVAQCDQLRADLWTVRCRRQMLVHGCLDLLGQYSTLASFFPRSNSRSSPHRPICYARWANELLQDFNIETIHRLHSVASALLMSTSNANADFAAVTNYRRSLHASIANSAAHLENVCVRLRAEKLDEVDSNMAMTPLQACEESRSSIVRFIAAEGGLMRGGAAIQCVALTALARLNRQFLSMESAATSASGESLSVLCSQEGDWFLEEMCHVITAVSQIASVMEMDGAWGGEIGSVGVAVNLGEDTPQLRDALQCLQTAYGIFKGLQDLNFNVRTIILPEALKSVIGEEPSVLMMMGLLDILERNLGADLTRHFGPDVDTTRSPTKRLLSVLQAHLQFVAIGAESPHAAAPAIAERLCRQFEEVLRNDEEIVAPKREQDGGAVSHGNMSPGQMLLMGFNGLFEKVQREGCTLADSLPSIIPPRAWVETIDHLTESEALLGAMLRPETRDTQETLLHAHRVHAIREFFFLCQSAADGFRSEGSGSVSEVELGDEEERICAPVKVFTAHAVQGLLLGAVTRCIAMAVCIIIHNSLGINVNETLKELLCQSSDNFLGSSKHISLEELCRNAVEVCCHRDSQGIQSASTQLSNSPLLSPVLTMSMGSLQTIRLPSVASNAIPSMDSNNSEGMSLHELSPQPFDPAVLLAYTSEGHTNSSIVDSALPTFAALPNASNDSKMDLSHSQTAEELSRGESIRLFSVLPVSNATTKRVVPLLPSFPLSLLPVASSLLCTFQGHCDRLALQRRLLRDAEWARSSLQRLRLQVAAHAWLHGSEDDGLESQTDSMTMNILSRPRFLSELRECVSALSAIEPCVMESSDDYNGVIKTVVQRLKWEQDSNAAIGEVISAFEREFAHGGSELAREGSLSALLGSVGATLLHREGLRSGCQPIAPEAEAADSAFLRILNECETSIITQQQKLLKITSSGDLLTSSVKPDMAALCKITDPSLLQITPDNFKDTNSIRAFEVHIADRIRGVQVEMGEAQVAMEAADDGVRRCASRIRSLLATHHRLMSDVRSLLKNMLKFEDMASTGLDAFLHLYRSYSESFASLLRTLLAPPGSVPPQESPSTIGESTAAGGGGREVEEEEGSDGEDGEMMGGKADARRKRHALEQLHSLEAMTGRIYSGLVDLAANMAHSGCSQTAGDAQSKKRQAGRPKLVRQDGVCQSPVKVAQDVAKSATSPRAVRAGINSVGERNAYALSVWKRVKMKLEGRDPNPSKKSSIAEQVDYVIQEATSLDNLSLLYEGWTPWV